MVPGSRDDLSTTREATLRRDEHGEGVAQASEAMDKPPKPSKMKQLWAKTGLDLMTVLIMLK